MSDRILSPTAVDVTAFSGVSWRVGEDGSKGLYVAVSPRGEQNTFAGAEVFVARSLSTGVCWEKLGAVTTPATLGFVRGWGTGVLPDHVAGGGATNYSIDVELFNGELESYSDLDEARCSRANIARIGSEIVRFATADLNSDGVSYEVSDFERGLFGTGTADHRWSERFTLLDANTSYLPLPTDLTGVSLFVKIVPTGFTVDDVDAIEVDIPRSPDLIWDNRNVVDLFNAGLSPLIRDSVQGLTAVDTDDGIELRWNPIQDVTLRHYEVRVGTQWSGGWIVSQTPDTKLIIPKSATVAQTYWVCASYVGGMSSPIAASVTITPTTPTHQETGAATTDVPPEIAGHSNTELDGSDNIIISDGFLTGSYTATAVDAGAVATWEWLVYVDTFHEYLVNLEEWDFTLESLEAQRWTLDGPEPVPGDNGGDPDVTLDDYPTFEDWGQEWTLDGRVGSTSDFTNLKVELRFDTDGLGSWTAWEEYTPGRRLAQKCQVRVTLDRVSENWQRYVSSIRVEARL